MAAEGQEAPRATRGISFTGANVAATTKLLGIVGKVDGEMQNDGS